MNRDGDYHLPINPPGSHFREGFDVMMTEIELANWESEGGHEYWPRPRVTLREGLRPVQEEEATEIDMEYDCD